MSAYSLVRQGLRKVALAALEDNYPTMPVNFSHTNGEEEAESYVVVNILSMQQEGHHSSSTLTNTDEELSVFVAYEVMVQYSFVGSLSGEAVQSFTQRINNNPIVFEELGRNKLGVLRKSLVRRAPQKRETQWIEGFNMDVTFSYILNTQQLVDVIEVVVMQDDLTGDVFTIPPGVVLP